MIVRAWRKEDIQKLVALEKMCFSDAWTEDEMESCLRFPFYKTFLLELDGELVGYSCETVLFEDAEIMNIAIAPKYRKNGYGKKLLTEMLVVAKSLGAEQAFLEVRESNLSAKGLYESFGFERMGVRKGYYPDGEDAIVMTKKI